MHEPRVVLVLVQLKLKFCTASPHEDYQDWICGCACRDKRSALEMRREHKSGDLQPSLTSGRIRTRSYEDLPTGWFLFQTIMHEQCSIRLYDSPATNFQWSDHTSQRIRVWHDGEVAGICGEMLSPRTWSHEQLQYMKWAYSLRRTSAAAR